MGEGFCQSSLGTHTKSGGLTTFVSTPPETRRSFGGFLGSPNFHALMYVRLPGSCGCGALEEYLPKLCARSPRVTEDGGLTYMSVGRLGRTSSESNLIECRGSWSARQASAQLGPASEEQPSEACCTPLRAQTYLVLAKNLIHMYHTIFFLAAGFQLALLVKV
jgi:hypothetical protein